VDPDAIHAARTRLRRELARALREPLAATHAAMAVPGPYSPAPEPAGRRALRNACLGYLMELDDPAVRAQCVAQFERADNMTDADGRARRARELRLPRAAAAAGRVP